MIVFVWTDLVHDVETQKRSRQRKPIDSFRPGHAVKKIIFDPIGSTEFSSIHLVIPSSIHFFGRTGVGRVISGGYSVVLAGLGHLPRGRLAG